MKTTSLPARDFFPDFLLQPLSLIEHRWAEDGFETGDMLDADHDFLVQNRRPDLVMTKTRDQILWIVDLS